MMSCLYIHIPFCARKCLYCDFFSLPYDEPLARSYTDALCRELDIRKASAGELKSVFFGGGTPSMLPPACFGQIFDRIRNNFSLSPAVEISVEMNPGTVRPQTIDMLLSLGVNRFSLGVQSLRDEELKTLGRIHSSEEALGTIDMLKAAGAANFSVDLLYGIPGQTISSWQETLSAAAGLSATHISAYELTPEKGTPLSVAIGSGQLFLPNEEIVTSMFGTAIDILGSAGYRQYEISNYARAGFTCLHNCNYWDRGEYIGAGAGAHSFLDGMRWMNTKDIVSYMAVLEANILPEESRTPVSPEDAAREFLFLGLRRTEGIDIKKSAALGLHIEEVCGDLVEEGYMANNGSSLALTEKGLIISNTVIVTLFERLGL